MALSAIGSDVDLVKWRNGGTTTYAITGGGTPEGTCRAGQEEVSNIGKVKHSTGAASRIRGQVSVTVCFPPSGRPVHLAKGTTFDF